MKSQNKTRNARVDWIVELFPFAVPDPLDESSAAPSLAGAIGGIQILSSQDTKVTKSGPKGLVSVSLGRHKSSPDSPCNMTYVGDLPEALVIGTWVIVSTLSSASAQPIPRFLGQIQGVSSAYMTQSNGLVALQHEVQVREWSSCLRMEVRFNPVSILASLSTAPGGIGAALLPALGAAAALTGAADPSQFTPAKLGEIFASSLNPYQMAQVILALTGAIAGIDTSPNVQALQIAQYPQIATAMPSIPKKLLVRMGVDPSVVTENAFAPPTGVRGFISVISGVQTEPFKNDGTWTGLLSASELDALRSAYNSSPGDKPASVGVSALSQFSYSVWDILTNYCEPTVNEVFTDILYTTNNDGSITPHPTIFFRDKPFLMEETKTKAADLGLDIQTQWSMYENVPRVYLDDVNIIGLKINNSFLNSPNYIQPDFASSIVSKDVASSAALATGLVKLQSLQNRWGGDPAYPSVSYTFINAAKGGTFGSGAAIAPDASMKLPDYFKEIKGLMVAWHSFNYLMGTGSLIIKDPGVPLTIGTNVQFSFGGRTLVGHIDGIDMQMQVDDKGNIITQIHLQLQRIVAHIFSETPGLAGKLRLLKIGEASRLHQPPHVGEDEQAESSSPSTPAGLLNSITNIGIGGP